MYFGVQQMLKMMRSRGVGNAWIFCLAEWQDSLPFRHSLVMDTDFLEVSKIFIYAGPASRLGGMLTK